MAKTLSRLSAPSSMSTNSTHFKDYLINGGRVVRDGAVVRLSIPPTTRAAYADAQLDDYDHITRTFANTPPQHVRIRARFSHPSGKLKGTAGFGFWNHPFTQAGGVIEPPRNLWFFYGSPESDMQVVRGMPGHGFKAAVLKSPLPLGEGGVREAVTKAMIVAGNLALKLPIARTLAMRAAQRMVRAHEAALDFDMTQWQDYDLLWQRDEAIFCVNGREVLRAPKPPSGSLGFVAWIDNYRATATPDGRYEFGYVDVIEEQWLELEIDPSP